MREAVSFSVVLKSNIWVGEYNTMNQHNCKKNGTTAKQNVQLQKKQHNCEIVRRNHTGNQHNCEKNGTTAKQNVQLQKKKHNCETHLLQLYIFWQYLTIVLIVLFTFPFLFYLFPRSHATQQWLSTKLPPADAVSHCLSRATLFFYFCFIPLPSVKSSFYESPLGGHGSLMRSYVTFYCAHTVHSRYDITSMDDVVYILRRICRRSSQYSTV